MQKTEQLRANLPNGCAIKIDQKDVIVSAIGVAEMTGYEEDILASRKHNAFDKLNLVLAGCIVAMYDAEGNKYDNKASIEFAINRMTSLDRFFAMLKVRQASIGDEFAFEFVCPSCNNKSVVKVDLNTAVQFEPMKDKKFVYGVTLPSGKQATLKIPTAQEELKVTQAIEKDDAASQFVLARIVDIDNIPGNMELVKSLSLKDRNFLRKTFVEHEGQMDSDLDVVCNTCSEHTLTAIDLGQPSFFFQEM